VATVLATPDQHVGANSWCTPAFAIHNEIHHGSQLACNADVSSAFQAQCLQIIDTIEPPASKQPEYTPTTPVIPGSVIQVCPSVQAPFIGPTARNLEESGKFNALVIIRGDPLSA